MSKGYFVRVYEVFNWDTLRHPVEIWGPYKYHILACWIAAWNRGFDERKNVFYVLFHPDNMVELLAPYPTDWEDILPQPAGKAHRTRFK